MTTPDEFEQHASSAASSWRNVEDQYMTTLAEKGDLLVQLAEKNTYIDELLSKSQTQGFDPAKVRRDLPVITGPINTPGTIENRLIAQASPRVADIRFKNCQGVSNGKPTTSRIILDCSYASAQRCVIEDSDFSVSPADESGFWSEAIRLGKDTIAIRTTVQGTTDGFGWHDRGGRTVEPKMIDCVVKGLPYFYVDPTGKHKDGTHNDAIQSHSPIGVGALILGGDYDAGVNGTAGFLGNVSSAQLTAMYATFRNGRSAFNFGPMPSGVINLIGIKMLSPKSVYVKPTVTVNLFASTNDSGQQAVRSNS